jgi:hypothetical protein
MECNEKIARAALIGRVVEREIKRATSGCLVYKGTCCEYAKYKTEKATRSKTAVGCGTPYTAIANDA